jgi:Cu2+-exporting ATPase
MPDEKAAIVTRLRDEGRVVAVVGDGINDSPALSLAHVSISLHRAADVARENADVVLMDSNLWKLPHAITLAHECMALIHQNFAAVAAPNAAGLALGVAGMIGPFGATVLNNGSSVVAAANSLRPMLRIGQAGLTVAGR